MQQYYEKFRLYKNYIMIVAASIFCLAFFPFVGSTVGMAFVLPTTLACWLVFIISKLMVAAVNMLLLYCFVNQGKFNIREDKRYLAALQLLGKLNNTQAMKPISPTTHYATVFGVKGTTLFITSLLSAFTLTQAILTFDAITFLTYLITLIMGVFFGIIQMGEEEIYWTEDYPYYVQYLVRQEEIKHNIANEQIKTNGGDSKGDIQC